MSAVVILPPSARTDLSTRSNVERQALLHVAGTSLWARGGFVVRLRPQATTLLLAVAGAPGMRLDRQSIFAALWPDADQQPLNAARHVNVVVRQAGGLADLRVRLAADYGFGRELVLGAIPRRVDSARPRKPLAPRGNQHWLPQAVAMRERGATLQQIADAVGRSPSLVGRELSGRERLAGTWVPTDRAGERSQRQGLRRHAREEARATGKPVEAVAIAWGCGRQIRSRLWDERAAARLAAAEGR